MSSRKMAVLLGLVLDEKWTEVNEYLKKGHYGNLHDSNYEGETILIQACEKGATSTVMCLMQLPVFDSLLNDTIADGSNAFMIACAKGHLDIVNLLLERPVNINATNMAGWTAFTMACHYGNVDIVKRLLEIPHVNVTATNDFGSDGFLSACIRGHTQVVEALINHKDIDVNKTHLNVRQESPARKGKSFNTKQRVADNDGCSPLVYACSSGYDEIVALLLSHPLIDVNKPNANGRSAFMRACKNGHVGIVRQLLNRPDLDINQVDRNGWNALLWAVSESRIEVINILATQLTLDVNQYANNGVTALLRACQYADVNVVTALLQHPNIDVNVTNKNGMTSLMYACSQGESAIVTQLLSHPHIDVNHMNQSSGTACMYASKNGHYEMVALLIAHPEFEFNIQDETGWHSLLFAASNGHEAIVDLLLQHSEVDVNLPNANGETSLMQACHHGHLEVVIKLLNHPLIDVNAQDNDGWTALMLACSFGYTAIVDEFLKTELLVDFNHTNHSGFTGLMLACQNGHNEIAVNLIKHGNVNINATSTVGVSALMLCCEKGNLQLIHAFFDAVDAIELDVNQKNHEGMTAADFLARNLHCSETDPTFNEDITQIITKLIQMGSSLNERKRSTVCKGECKGQSINLAQIAWNKKWPLVEEYLNEDSFGDINKTYLGFSVLHRASTDGQERLVAKILTYKTVDIDQLDKDGKTALDLAIDNRRVGCVQLLLSAGAVIYHSVKSKSREFHRTTESADERELATQAQIQELLINELREREKYPLHSMLRFGRVQDCIDSLPQYTNTLEEVDADGKTILIVAAEKGLVDLVTALLHAGAEIDNVQWDPSTSINGKTALVFATMAGHADVVQVLLSNLADMDVVFTENHNKYTVLTWIDSQLEQQFDTKLLDCRDMIEKEIFYRANSSVYVDKLRSNLYARRTNEPFDEGLFKRVVNADPTLGRILLDDCIEPDRHTLGFTKLDEVYGGELIQNSALYTLVNYSSDNTERIYQAKKLLEHVVMQRILQLKWEFFAQRLFIEELLMHIVLVVSMTLSVTIEPTQSESHSSEMTEMTMWVIMMVFVANGLLGVQALKPNTLWSLAKGLEHGWPSPIVPPFASLKTMVKWIITALVFIGTLGVTALLLWLVFPHLPEHVSSFLVYGSLGLSTLYFTLLEFKEYRGETETSKKKKATSFHIGWKYFESFVNLWQLGTYLVILCLYLPAVIGLIPLFSNDVQLALGASLTLSLWILSLQYFAVFQTAGYLLPMMSGLLVDVANFFSFYSVFQIGLTCVFYQILHERGFGYDTLWMSFTKTYFVMLGQYDIRDDIDDKDEPFINIFTMVVLMIHATVSVIMLMNVLLAIMNKTVDRGLERSKTEAVWAFADFVLRMELTLGAEERENLTILNRPGYTDANPEEVDEERTPLLRKLTSAKQPKHRTGILNPAFHDKILKAECALDDEDIRVIKELEETVHEWKQQLINLQTTIENEIERLLQSIIHANHFSSKPIFQKDAELIAATKANVALRFRVILEKRPPELKDMPTRIKEVQKAVEKECVEFQTAINTTPDTEADEFFYNMVHGITLNRSIERGIEAIRAQFGKTVEAFQHKAEEELTLGDLQQLASEIQQTQVAAFKDQSLRLGLLEQQNNAFKPPSLPLKSSISLGGQAKLDDGLMSKSMENMMKMQLEMARQEAAVKHADIVSKMDKLETMMQALMAKLDAQ